MTWRHRTIWLGLAMLAGDGVLMAADLPVQLDIGLTTIVQGASDRRVDDDATLSLDLLLSIRSGPGSWHAYFDASSTPHSGRVASVLGESNGDAGSALDRNDHGRLQLSELHYNLPLRNGNLSIGLIGPGSVLDTSTVANDQNRQFLLTSLVNNPAIAMPDYTLGMAWSRPADSRQTGLVVFVGSSHGLADNPKRSYRELAELDARGKGLFAAIEITPAYRHTRLTFGAWYRNDDNPRLDDDTRNEANYGLYLLADTSRFGWHWNLRAGLANPHVSQAARFVSVAGERHVGKRVLGAGIAWSGLSPTGNQSGQDDRIEAEVHLRWHLGKSVQITPLVQWIRHSQFDSSGSSFDRHVWIVALRLSYGDTRRAEKLDHLMNVLLTHLPVIGR